MLKRLTNANEEIVEILLGNNFVIEALHFCIEHFSLNDIVFDLSLYELFLSLHHDVSE